MLPTRVCNHPSHSTRMNLLADRHAQDEAEESNNGAPKSRHTRIWNNKSYLSVSNDDKIKRSALGTHLRISSAPFLCFYKRKSTVTDIYRVETMTNLIPMVSLQRIRRSNCRSFAKRALPHPRPLLFALRMSKPSVPSKPAAASKPPAAASSASASAAAAAAAVTAAAVAADLKSLVKSLKASMDSGSFSDALAAFEQSPVGCSPAALAASIEAAHRDPKRQTTLYTLLAFAGLSAAHTKQISKAEDLYRKATGLQEEQFPAWKVRTRHTRTTAQRAERRRLPLGG